MSIIHVDDMAPGGTDQAKVEKAIERAQQEANADNKTSTVYFSERTYRLTRPLVVESHVFLSSTGQGRRSTRLVFFNVKSNTALITLRHGYAAGIRGLQIHADPDANVTNVIGLYCEALGGCVLSNFSIDMTTLGANGVGIAHARREIWGESNTFEKFNVLAPRPVIILSGDNLVFRDFVVTCLGAVTGDAVMACFQAGNKTTPDHWVIGPGSGQKGDHAFFIRSKVKRVGSGLIIRDFRWEQGESNDAPAWVVDIKRTHATGERLHALAFLVMSGCQNAQRTNATEIEGVLTMDIANGNYLPGTWLRQKRDGSLDSAG